MNIRSFTVRPSLPKRLTPLMDIARNISWCWNPEAVKLFQRIDYDLWETTYHNPIKLLGEVSQQRLEFLEHDESFLAHMENVAVELEDYLNRKLWFDTNYPDRKDLKLFYFSMEFGLHESLPVYSGGLGLLAGDHLKAASDLALPLMGIGLLYRQGFFKQYLNAEGWQQETYPENDFANLPITKVKDKDGAELTCSIQFPGRDVHFQIWQVKVGTIKLFLLDTNLEMNSPEDREITAQLYGGNQETRIQQEIILGIGGIRAITAMGMMPNICHMNEGHSAFLALERIRHFMAENNLEFTEAAEMVTASNIFTTHTPVPAGNEVFPEDMMEKYFSDFYPSLKLDREQFLGLGRQNPFDKNEPFGMTVLALKLAAHANGVSKLHGEVSRDMWKNIWPGIEADEVPIDHVTNGIHTTGWISPDMNQLFTRYLGPRWTLHAQDEKIWQRVDRIPDSELWRTHERRRERLVAFARRRVVQQLSSRGAKPSELERAKEILDPEALTLGFARRFASYKRGDMLLSDLDRLERLLNDKDKPVQIIFAGKAHPADNTGKELIKKIIQTSRQSRFKNKIIFIEDYDINVGHYLVQGVDVWVNNPRRPLEASGTSGMKVAANGGLNLSILDGWWVEAYDGSNGWSIGDGEEYEDHEYQDMVEARALFDTLEEEVIPLFYKRKKDGLPRDWIAMMKRSLISNCPVYNTNRMVIEYLEKFYLPGAAARLKFMADDFKAAKEMAAWKSSIRHRWMKIEIEEVDMNLGTDLNVGKTLPVKVIAKLDEISPDELQVETYYGRLNSQGKIVNGSSFILEHSEDFKDGRHEFVGSVPLENAGRCGCAIRILPKHPMMIQRFEPGLIIWG